MEFFRKSFEIVNEVDLMCDLANELGFLNKATNSPITYTEWKTSQTNFYYGKDALHKVYLQRNYRYEQCKHNSRSNEARDNYG